MAALHGVALSGGFEPALAGEPLTPERARELGLINRVCRAGGRAEATERFIAPLLEKSPATLREAKRALREGAAGTKDAALELIGRRYLGSLMRLEDAREGMAPFLEKRAPRWTNR